MADFPLDFRPPLNDEDHSNLYPSSFYQLFHTSSRGESSSSPDKHCDCTLWALPAIETGLPFLVASSRDYSHFSIRLGASNVSTQDTGHKQEAQPMKAGNQS